MRVIEPVYLEIGRRISWRRRILGLTQAELGARLRPPLQRASIANIEKAKQRMLAHTLGQLAEAMDCVVDDLMPEQNTQ